MEHTRRRDLFACLLGALLALPLSVSAIGQITEPIALGDALRGMSYDETVTVINTEKTPSRIGLNAEGDIAGWVRFYEKPEAAIAISAIDLGAGDKKEVTARITVPDTIANGTYEGVISVTGKPGEFVSNGTDSGSSVTQKIDRAIAVTVSDHEVVDFAVSLIPTSYDLGVGDLLSTRVQYDNRSNVDIRPQIALKLIRLQDEKAVYSAVFPYPDDLPAVKPGTIFEIPALEVPTGNLQEGKYRAAFHITETEQFSLDKDFKFSVGTVRGASTAAVAGTRASFIGDMDPFLRAASAMILTLFIIFIFRRMLVRPRRRSFVEQEDDFRF